MNIKVYNEFQNYSLEYDEKIITIPKKKIENKGGIVDFFDNYGCSISPASIVNIATIKNNANQKYYTPKCSQSKFLNIFSRIRLEVFRDAFFDSLINSYKTAKEGEVSFDNYDIFGKKEILDNFREFIDIDINLNASIDNLSKIQKLIREGGLIDQFSEKSSGDIQDRILEDLDREFGTGDNLDELQQKAGEELYDKETSLENDLEFLYGLIESNLDF
ncbi:hypothetical protein BKI52_32925 [marine bacterium AO1-C]|nr:hypothetical protein BKI52_32925 [marine bacterium AO1-C]